MPRPQLPRILVKQRRALSDPRLSNLLRKASCASLFRVNREAEGAPWAGPLAPLGGVCRAALSAEFSAPSAAYGAPARARRGPWRSPRSIYGQSPPRPAAGALSVRGFLRSIFPRRILLHPSSLIDMASVGR